MPPENGQLKRLLTKLADREAPPRGKWQSLLFIDNGGISCNLNPCREFN